MKIRFRYILLVVAVYVCSASLALGASITITSAGGGTFSVQGDNMDGVHAIDLTIKYDPSALASPAVRWGRLVAGAMNLANPATIPGTIRIASMRVDQTFSGNGPIATLSFATHNGDCGITEFSATLLDINNAHVPVQAVKAPGTACAAAADPALITTPGVPFSQPQTPAVQTTTTAATTAAAAAATATAASATSALPQVGTVVIPGENQPAKEAQAAESKTASSTPEPAERPDAVIPQIKQSSPEKAAEEGEPASIKQTVYGSVLDRFRQYQGERTPDVLIALFTKGISSTIHQEPPVVVSDGHETVRVTVDLTAIKSTSTNFALTGANLVSLKNEDEAGKWVLNVLPQANTLKAAVTVANSRELIDFPLTVVPPSAGITGKKADFEAFLKDSGVKAPKYDLNGDGRHDYLDDFIYTAHYLIVSRGAGRAAK